MTAAGPAEAILHPALEEPCGAPLDEARLTDRGRIAVVLQGAALLAHLEHGSWHLTQGWRGARVGADGVLRVAGARPGRPRQLPQELLRGLVRALFGGEDGVAGRGPARRVARELLAEWRQSLTPLGPDHAVGRILEAAPFLWEPAFVAGRRSLVGEHRGEDGATTWVAGPGPCRNRLRTLTERTEIEKLLGSAEARDTWEGVRATAEPRGAERWRADVARFSRRPPAGAAEGLRFARALFALGKFQRALGELEGRRDAEAVVLRAWCQHLLGEMAATRETLRRLPVEALTAEQTVELAEVAVRLHAKSEDREALNDWVARARRAARGVLRPRAELLAALAARTQGDTAAMARHLEAARPALEYADQAWRWRSMAGLRAFLVADGAGAVEHLSAALRLARRRLTRLEAAELWGDLAVGRALADDLAGAERACVQAVRLFAGCEGPRRDCLALYNLAEIRLRRGRLLGVREILDAATEADRRSGYLRGIVQDVELWARYELVQGRAHAALEKCRWGLRELADRRSDWHRAELSLLAARACGWLGRRDEAAAALAGCAAETLAMLEPEERPAVFAQAGDIERAIAEAANSRSPALWRAVLTGRVPPPTAWSELQPLERYRAARLLFDLVLVAPAVVPVYWQRRAAADLRRSGAAALAERLESTEMGAWPAVDAYLRGKPGAPAALGQLLVGAGYGEVRLSWVRGGSEQVLVDGPGGGEELAGALDGGQLVLRAPLIDAALRALFALALRDARPCGGEDAGGDRAPAPGGLVGRSRTLGTALHRLERLAPGDLPILILGETGTGKELVAQRVHQLSRRAAAPFLPLNCAALSETLLLSELFGHARGAFTGADRDRSGIFESARGGTVFLDEIGDLPLLAQGMLLRALQEGEVRRVGESQPRKVDVRVVAATHRDLRAMVESGAFRRDLYYRLGVASVELPPLRERGEDVHLLAEHFLARRTAAGKSPRLAPRARARLLTHPWPGNVRELQNVLEVAAALAEDGVIQAEHLDLPPAGAARLTGYHQQVESFRRGLVESALVAGGGNLAEAARRLGLSRQALSYLVRQLAIAGVSSRPRRR